MQRQPARGKDLPTDPPDADDLSRPFVGRWQHLVSTTNWEKGRVICQWRDALVAQGAPAAEYADEAWSGRVGGISSQHVGRLRRVYRRFAQVHDQYQGLYWSHFHAALDWHDAEMWLEGAVQSGWSVGQMRTERWQALGGPDSLRPTADDAADADDSDGEGDLPALWQSPSRTVEGALAEVYPPGPPEPATRRPKGKKGKQGRRGEAGASGGRKEAGRDGRKEAGRGGRKEAGRGEAGGGEGQPSTRHRPFADLRPLPEDLAEALETFKLAILRHKLAGWVDVSLGEVVDALEALKALAEAPGED